MKYTRKSARRGFTLVEMLVSIIIIGIVSTIAATRIGSTSTANAQAAQLEGFINDSAASIQTALVHCAQNDRRAVSMVMPTALAYGAGPDLTFFLKGDDSVIQPAKRTCADNLGLVANNNLKYAPYVKPGFTVYYHTLAGVGVAAYLNNIVGGGNPSYVEFRMRGLSPEVAQILWNRLDPLHTNAWTGSTLTSGSVVTAQNPVPVYTITWSTDVTPTTFIYRRVF